MSVPIRIIKFLTRKFLIDCMQRGGGPFSLCPLSETDVNMWCPAAHTNHLESSELFNVFQGERVPLRVGL